MDKEDDCNQDGGNVDFSLAERREDEGDPTSLLYKLEMTQRVTREWASVLTTAEFTVTMVILDRTVGWGATSTVVSTGSIMYGGGVYSGLNISRRALFRVLASLEEKKIIRRSKTRTGALRISFNIGWSPEMLKLPKRLQNKDENTPENTPEDPCQIGTTPCHSGTTPCQIGTLYTDTTSTDITFTGKIVPASGHDDGYPGKFKEESLVPEKNFKKMKTAKSKPIITRPMKVSRGLSRTDVSTAMEAAWRTAYEETFPSAAIVPWPTHHRKNVKDKAKAWTHNKDVTLVDLIDWSVRNWTRIMAKEFSWMNRPKAPIVPAIGLFIRFYEKFADSYVTGELEEYLGKKERTELERMVGRGMSREEAVATIARRHAVGNLRDEMTKREAAAQQKLREARMVRDQARELAKKVNVPPRRSEPPKVKIEPRENIIFDESTFPMLPKENPFR